MLSRFNILKFVMLLTVLSAAPLCAQNIDSLDLQLNHSEANQTTRHITVPRNGEFKLSLGSQLFNESENKSETQTSPEVTRIEIAESFSDLGSMNIGHTDTIPPAQLRLRSSNLIENQRFMPTITLSSSYEDNAIGPNDKSAESLSIKSESGKLHIYGELERQHIQTVPSQAPLTTGATSGPALRSSIVAQDSDGQQKPEPHEKSTALASRYYLEAVYSFKPTLKGKVSFNRSMIDTYDSEEKLQVEGIVEANQNVLIKAGYKNEVRPEVTDTKSSKDTKVWTEFILKF